MEIHRDILPVWGGEYGILEWFPYKLVTFDQASLTERQHTWIIFHDKNIDIQATFHFQGDLLGYLDHTVGGR